MKAGAALLVVVSACGRIGFGAGTELDATISAAPGLTIVDLDAHLTFATLDPSALFAIPAVGGAPTLPTDVAFALPDASGPLAIEADAHDTSGRALSATATVAITDDQTATVTLVIGGELPANCSDGVTDGDESGVDCGGSCPPCPVGGECVTASDCATASCIAGSCEPASGPPSWLPIADMPIARIGHVAATGSDARIYVFGGAVEDDDTPYSEVDSYVVARDEWASAPPLPTGESRTAGAADGSGSLFVIGGVEAPTVVETFAPAISQWSTAAALPTGRGYMAGASDRNGTVYAFGGSPDAGGTELAEADSLVGGVWITHAPMPTARANLAAARAADGTLLTIGGHPGLLTTVEAYDPTTGIWHTVASMNHGRSDLAAVLGADGRTYAIGGFDGAGGVAYVEAYRGAKWIDVAPVSVGRDACAATLGPDGRIFVFGGRTATVALASAEAYGPRLMIGSVVGAAGAIVAMTGSNFAANATVRIYFDAIPVALGTTDAAGAFATLNVAVPALAAGAHVVRANDDHSQYPVTVAFTID